MGKCRDSIDRVQAPLQCAPGGRDQSRPYMLMPDSLVHVHHCAQVDVINRVPIFRLNHRCLMDK